MGVISKWSSSDIEQQQQKTQKKTLFDGKQKWTQSILNKTVLI